MSNAYRDKVLKAAYAYCGRINAAHYENFPVASVLLPRKIRPAVDVIYAFSRIADDFADEPEFDGERLELLNAWESHLKQSSPTHPVFLALQDVKKNHNIPDELFLDLLSAFKQDVTKTRYASFMEVLDYCRRSANPVGRLVLSLFGLATPENIRFSDAICTALQLANFWQDVSVDLQKNRIYIPREDLDEYGVGEVDLFENHFSEKLEKLIRFQVQRTREIFLMGHELGLIVTGRLGAELRLTWLTGMRILEKIEANGFDVLDKRPVLGKRDFLKALCAALNRKAYAKAAL